MVEKLKCNERLKITLDITIHWKIKSVIKSKPQILFSEWKKKTKTKTQEIKRRGQKEKRRYRQICQEHIMEEQSF